MSSGADKATEAENLKEVRSKKIANLTTRGKSVVAKKKANTAAGKPAGSGENFKAVEKAAAKSGAKNPAAVAAAAGDKKYGKAKMEQMAQAGKAKKAAAKKGTPTNGK